MRVVTDPIRGAPHVLVMCEVYAPDGTPHPTNTRAKLREIIDDKVVAEDCWYGFEQEYTMLQKTTGQIYGWPSGGYPAPQVRPATRGRTPRMQALRAWLPCALEAFALSGNCNMAQGCCWC